MKRLALTIYSAAALLVSAAVSMAGGLSPADEANPVGMSLVAVGGYLTWAVIAIFVMVIVPRRSAVIAALSMIAILIGFSAAGAQTTPPLTPSAPSAIDMLRPYLRDLFYTIGSILMGLATLYVKQRWGIDLDAARRASFQTASTNAAGLYATTGDMSRAVEYLKDAAPDAIKHFDITAAQLPEKIQAKAGIIEAGGGVIPVMPGAVDAIAMRGQGL